MTVAVNRRSVLSGVVAAFAATTMTAGFVTLAQGTVKRPANHTVEISGFKFDPVTLNVRPGDTITWINRDIAPHTATAEDGSWDTGRINTGESMSVEVEPGMALFYFCRFHPGMKARFEILAGE